MLSIDNILETNQMIHDNKLDVRTITMGISLLECASSSGKELCDRIYDRITKEAEHLVSTGEDIEREFGIPIINKRISVTPISLVAGGSDLTSYVPIAEAMDRAAKTVGVNFIGGFSALVTKGATRADRILRISPQQARKGRSRAPRQAPCPRPRRTRLSPRRRCSRPIGRRGTRRRPPRSSRKVGRGGSPLR